MQDQPDRPGIAIFPPLLIVLGFLTAVGLHWFWPLPVPSESLAFWIGIIVSLLGVGLAAWGGITLVKGGTNVSPLKPTTAIVLAGPYRFTRNPLYMGAMTLLLGLSLAIGTWWGFVAIIPVFYILHHGVVLREERYLERKFGDSYIQYRSSVRRCL